MWKFHPEATAKIPHICQASRQLHGECRITIESRSPTHRNYVRGWLGNTKSCQKGDHLNALIGGIGDSRSRATQRPAHLGKPPSAGLAPPAQSCLGASSRTAKRQQPHPWQQRACPNLPRHRCWRPLLGAAVRRRTRQHIAWFRLARPVERGRFSGTCVA